MLTLSVPTFFRCFHHLQKIDCNSANFGHKNTNYISNERYCPWLFASWVNFWNYFWRSGEICLWKSPFFEGCEEIHTPLVLKGLKSSKGYSNIMVYYCSKNFRSQNPTQIKKLPYREKKKKRWIKWLIKVDKYFVDITKSTKSRYIL